MTKTENSELLIDMIDDGDMYQIWTAFHPEMGLPSYAVYNKKTHVIENFQPAYANVLNVRDELIKWYKDWQKGNAVEAMRELDKVDQVTAS